MPRPQTLDAVLKVDEQIDKRLTAPGTAARAWSRITCYPASVVGNPNARDVSTSYVERQNLTMRMSMRRFTRLTNAFSKKVENHAAAVALYTLHYNFCRVHQALRVTPAMEAGLSDHVWTITELIGLLDHA